MRWCPQRRRGPSLLLVTTMSFLRMLVRVLSADSPTCPHREERLSRVTRFRAGGAAPSAATRSRNDRCVGRRCSPWDSPELPCVQWRQPRDGATAESLKSRWRRTRGDSGTKSTVDNGGPFLSAGSAIFPRRIAGAAHWTYGSCGEWRNRRSFSRSTAKSRSRMFCPDPVPLGVDYCRESGRVGRVWRCGWKASVKARRSRSVGSLPSIGFMIERCEFTWL